MERSVHPQFQVEAKDVSAEPFLAIEREHVALGIEIDALTAVTAWQGEVMDYGLGVEALLRRDRRGL